MTITLLKRVCPFCDNTDNFATMQNARRHIHNVHGVLLPSRAKADQPTKHSKPYTIANHQVHPTGAIKLMCPSCSQLFEDRPVLKQHVEDQHLVFTLDSQRDNNNPNDWKIDATNVTEKFKDFRKHCVQNSVEYTNLDIYFNHLLAISSILVLQRRNLYESLPTTYFDPKQLKEIHMSLMQDLSWRKTFDHLDSACIKNILADYRDNLMDNFDARLALMMLAKSKHGPERNVILAVESMLSALKDLDIPQLSESDLTASYVHPLMQSLFAIHSPIHVAHCSNNLPTDDNEGNKRPDYIVDVYEQYHFAYSSCYGEVKTEKSSETLKILDFYRLALFGKTGMDQHNLNGVICFQTIGMSTTFYYMTRKSDMMVFVELTTIITPKTKQDVISIIAYLDDLYSMANLHLSLKKNDDEAPSPFPNLPYDYVQFKVKTLPRKRRVSLGAIVSTSKR